MSARVTTPDDFLKLEKENEKLRRLIDELTRGSEVVEEAVSIRDTAVARPPKGDVGNGVGAGINADKETK